MFAARLLLGEFVTGYEVSGGVGAPKGTPVEVIETASQAPRRQRATRARGSSFSDLSNSNGYFRWCTPTGHGGLPGRLRNRETERLGRFEVDG